MEFQTYKTKQLKIVHKMKPTPNIQYIASKGDGLRLRKIPIHRNHVCYQRQNNVIYLYFEYFLILILCLWYIAGIRILIFLIWIHLKMHWNPKCLSMKFINNAFYNFTDPKAWFTEWLKQVLLFWIIKRTFILKFQSKIKHRKYTEFNWFVQYTANCFHENCYTKYWMKITNKDRQQNIFVFQKALIQIFHNSFLTTQ